MGNLDKSHLIAPIFLRCLTVLKEGEYCLSMAKV